MESAPHPDPKAELHLHIEGTLTPELKRQFADRNKIALGDKCFAALKIDPGDFTPEELGGFMINAFDAAWLPRDVRDGYIRQVKDYVSAYIGARPAA